MRNSMHNLTFSDYKEFLKTIKLNPSAFFVFDAEPSEEYPKGVLRTMRLDDKPEIQNGCVRVYFRAGGLWCLLVNINTHKSAICSIGRGKGALPDLYCENDGCTKEFEAWLNSRNVGLGK